LPNIYSVAEYIVIAESIAESLFIAESFEKCFARNILYGIKLSKNVSRETFYMELNLAKMFRAKHFYYFWLKI